MFGNPAVDFVIGLERNWSNVSEAPIPNGSPVSSSRRVAILVNGCGRAVSPVELSEALARVKVRAIAELPGWVPLPREEMTRDDEPRHSCYRLQPHAAS